MRVASSPRAMHIVPVYRAADDDIAARLPCVLASGGRVLQVFNKRDAVADDTLAALPPDALVLSARTGDGLAALRSRLLALAGWHGGPEGVCELERGGRRGVLILYDTADKGRVRGRRYRADWVALPAVQLRSAAKIA